MKVSSENYQNLLSANSDIDQTASASKMDKGTDNRQNSSIFSSEDTIEISGQAATLARAELRESEATTQSDAQAESGEATPEDPLTRFVNTILKMMEERQEIQLENAADQAEKQKTEMEKGREQPAATYGKTGGPTGAGPTYTGIKSNYIATA